MPKLLVIFLCVFITWQEAKAQDANYWSSNYNPGGYLTPGAVIAFNRDSGVMFLNPALLAYSNKSTASISGSVYQFSGINIKNGAGTGLDLKSTSANIIPQIVAGTIAIKGSHPFTVGYALTHNPLISFRSNQQRDGRFNVLDDAYSPGNEYFLGQYSNQNVINETSGILSGGFKATDRLAIGLTIEGLFRKQDYSVSATQRAQYNIPANGSLPPFANVLNSYQASYYHAGIRFKFGAGYNMDKHHFGITISAPQFALKGSGSLLSDNQITDLRTPPDLDTINLLAYSRQQNLKAKFKTPLSVAFGYAYDLKKGQLYIAAEYFAKIKQYNILTPKSQNYIKGGDDSDDLASLFLNFRDSRKQVVNIGIGGSIELQPEVTAYASFHTDFSFVNHIEDFDIDGYKFNTANYNLYRSQLGANLKKRKFNLRAGFLLAYGSTNKYLQPVNYDSASDATFLTGNTGYTKASQVSVGLMISYIHNL
jgi:hypothetical protein